MQDKTIHYTIAFSLIFVCLLSINQVMHTQEKKVENHEKKPSSFSPALAAYTGTSLACAAIGLQLPCTSPAATALMRTYFLTSLMAQTLAGTGISLSETLKAEQPSWAKAATDIGYGVYNMAFVELARRLPYNSPSRALLLKRYATFCLLSQALGVVAKDYARPAYCALKQKAGDYIATLSPEQFEETAAYLPWTE